LEFTHPHSYAVGGSPVKWDIATILRELGNYNLAVAIMGVVYGTTLHQKWEAFSQLFRKKRHQKPASSSVQPEQITINK
jgi:hypothetical protein